VSYIPAVTSWVQQHLPDNNPTSFLLLPLEMQLPAGGLVADGATQWLKVGDLMMQRCVNFHIRTVTTDASSNSLQGGRAMLYWLCRLSRHTWHGQHGLWSWTWSVSRSCSRLWYRAVQPATML
jgi:hypothetical protein